MPSTESQPERVSTEHEQSSGGSGYTIPDPPLWEPPFLSGGTAGERALRRSDPPLPIISGIAYPACVGCIAGDSGIGKSFLGLQMLAAVANGGDFLGRSIPEPVPVWYLNADLAGWALDIRLRDLLTRYPKAADNLRADDISGLCQRSRY